MNFKKRVNGSWIGTPHYIHKADTDTITTLPAVLYPTATTATVGLKGQAVQSGTPTPDSPIMPEGCGERTGNLLPSAAEQTLTSDGITIRCDGNGRYHVYGTTSNASIRIYFDIPSFVIPVSVGKGGNGTFNIFNTYTGGSNTGLLLYNGSTLVDTWGLNSLNKSSTSYSGMGGKTITKLAISISANKTIDGYISPMFTNDGVLPSEFEPYGIKIPISSANTTTPVYLGEVQTTRRVKKLVFDGTEKVAYNARNDDGGRFAVTVDIPITGTSVPYNVISSHLPTVNSVDVILLQTGICMRSTATDVVIAMAYGEVGITSPTNALTITTAVKSYLAQQYAAGTPVCVWYVLATEEIAVINEPLMKIGDYADTLSNVSIPVVAGGDTLSVGTTVQPSEVTVNYKGWHPATDVHERDNGAWT